MKSQYTRCIFSNLQFLIAIKPSLLLKYKILKRSLLSIVILSGSVLITACMPSSNGQESEEQQEDTASTSSIPGGRDIQSVHKPSGKVRLSHTIAQLSTPTSPGFPLDIAYQSNTYLDTLSSSRNIANSDIGMGWTFYANRFSVSRMNMGTGNFEDDIFKLQMGTESYSLQYQCDYPCSYHPEDKESTSIDGNTYEIKYYITNGTDFSVIKHIINTNDTGQTYSTWKVTAKDGKTYLYGGNSFTNTASLRTAEKDISDRTICKWLTNTAQFTTGSDVIVPGKLATGCQPGSVNIGVRWGNWIGANDHNLYKGEAETTYQEQFGAAWKLTAIEDIRGQKTNLFWAQNTQNVGLNGATDQSTITTGIQSFSRDSYLYKVEASNGDRLVLNYCPRGNDSSTVVGNYSINGLKTDRPKSYYECESATNLPTEAYDTNTVNVEPDGFQEPVRTMYLVAVDKVLNQPANQENSTDYDYNPDTRVLLDYDAVTMENNFSRRVLVGIETITKNQKIITVNQLTQLSPKTIFCYYGYISSANNCDDQATVAGSEGLLSKVLDALGNETHYTYKKQQITNQDINTTISGQLGLTKKTIVYGNGYAIVQGIRDLGNATNSDKIFDLDLYDMTPTGWKLHKSIMGTPGHKLGPFGDSYFFNQNITFVPNGFIFRASDRTLWFVKRTLGATSSWEEPVNIAPDYFGYENVGEFAVGTNFVGIMSETGAQYSVLSTFDNWETLEPVAIGNGTTGTLPSSSAPNTLRHLTAGPNYLAFWRAGTSSSNHIVTTDIIYQKEDRDWPTITAPIHKQHTKPVFCTDYMNEKHCEIISVATSSDILQAPSISNSQSGAVLAVDIPVEITTVNFAEQDIPVKGNPTYINYKRGTVSYSYAYWMDIPLDWDESAMTLSRVEPDLPTNEQISLSPFWYAHDNDGACDPEVDKSAGYIDSYLNGLQVSAVKTKYGTYSGAFRQQYIPVTKYTTKPCSSNATYVDIHTTTENDKTEAYAQCTFTTGSNVVVYDSYLSCQGNISPMGNTMLSLGANGLYQFYNFSPRDYSYTKVDGPNPSTSSLGTFTLVTPSTIANDIAVGLNVAFQLSTSMAAMGDPAGIIMMAAGEGLSMLTKATSPGSHYSAHWSSSNVSSIASGGDWVYQGDVLYYLETNGTLSEVYSLADPDDLKSKYFGALYNYIPFVVDDGTNHVIKVQNLANLNNKVTEGLWKKNTVTVSSVGSNNSQLYTVGQYNPVVEQGSNPMKEKVGRGAWDRYTNLSGPGAFLSYEYKNSSAPSFYSSPSDTYFDLYAVWSEYNSSGYVDYVVDVVTTKDGISSDENTVFYDYDLLQSSYSIAMQSGVYGKVTAYPGSENNIENLGKIVYKSHYSKNSDDQTLLYGMPISTSIYKQGQSSPVHQSFSSYQIDEYDLPLGPDPSDPKSVSVRTANLASMVTFDDQVFKGKVYEYTDFGLLRSVTSSDTLNFKPTNTEQTVANGRQTTYTYAWEDSAISDWVKATNMLSLPDSSTTTRTVADITDPHMIDNVEDKKHLSVVIDSLGPIQLGFLSFDRLEPAVPLTMGCFQSDKQAQIRTNDFKPCHYKEDRVMHLVKIRGDDGVTIRSKQAILKNGRVFDYELLSRSDIYQIRVSSEGQCLTALPQGDPEEPDLMTISACDETSSFQLFQFLSAKVTTTETNTPKVPEVSFHTSLALADLNMCFNSFTYGWQVWSECGMFISSNQNEASLTTPADVVIYKPVTQSEIQTSSNGNIFEWCKVPSENGGINSCTTTQPTRNVANLDGYTMISKQQTTLRNTEWNNGDTASIIPRTVVSRDPGSLTSTEVMDAFGVTHSAIVSNDGHLNPIAQFRNASVSKMEAGYKGFESYEQDSNKWNTTGGSVTELKQHTGLSSYGKGGADVWVQTASNINVSTGTQFYVASAWVFGTNAPCTLSIGGSSVSGTKANVWQYLEHTVTATNASNNVVSVQCTVGGFVDDIRYSPVASEFKANVYSATNNNYNPFWKIQASLSDNGSVTQHIYDQWHKPYVDIFVPITGTQRVHIPSVLGLSRLGGAGAYSYATYERNSFSTSRPNSAFNLSFNDADYDATFIPVDQENKNTQNNNSNVQASTSSTVDVSSTKVTLKKPDFAARAMLINPSINQKTTLFTWNNLSLNFTPSSTNLGKFVIDNAFTSEQYCSTKTEAYLPHDWIITAYDGLLVVLGDGKLLMYCDNYGENGITTPSFELVGNLWENLILAYDPTITMTYADAAGRSVQDHRLGMGVDIGMDNTSAVSSDTYTTVVKGVIYDHWGHPAIKGMPIVANYKFDYDPTLMSFDWDNNELQTDSDLYEFYSSSNSSDAQYAFLQTAYEQSPLGRPANKTSGTGQFFNLNASDNYSNYQNYQKPDDQSFATDQGITAYELFFKVNTTSQAFGAATKYKQSATDQSGTKVYALTTSGDSTTNPLLSANIKFGNQLDMQISGSPWINKSTLFLPNYFDTSISGSSSFVNQSRLKDNLGLWVTTVKPDISGMRHVIKDNKGRVRFAGTIPSIEDTEMLSVMAENFRYWKYDVYDRVIELGTLSDSPGSANYSKSAYDLANDTSFPAVAERCRKSIFQYDTQPQIGTITGVSAEEQQSIYRNWRGRLVTSTSWMTLTAESPQGIINNVTVQCQEGETKNVSLTSHYFNDFGHNIGVSESVFTNNGVPLSSRNTGYDFDEQKAVKSITYPTVDRTSGVTSNARYNFDLSGQVTLYNLRDSIHRLNAVCDKKTTDSLGNITCAGNQYIKATAYTFDRLLSNQELGNSTVEKSEYNFQRKLSLMETQNASGDSLFSEKLYYGVSPNGSSPSACGTQYYNSGYLVAKEISSSAESALNKTECYTYNVAGRLTQMLRSLDSGSTTTTYAYDPNGNMLSETQSDSSGDMNYTYKSGSNQLSKLSNSSVVPSYSDEGGVMILPVKPDGTSTVVTNKFTRDYHNQMPMQITNENCMVNYSYDAYGHRVKKESQDVKTNSCSSN